MDHLDNTDADYLPAAGGDGSAASQLERMGLGACADLSINSLLAAVEVKLSVLSAETGLAHDWHNTAMSLKNAAGFLLEAAEHIVSGDHAYGIPSDTWGTPERAVQVALSCVHRVYDGEKVRPVEPLPLV